MRDREKECLYKKIWRKTHPIAMFTDRKRNEAKRKGIPFELTKYDIMLKLMTAGITIEQVGQYRNDYNLSRYKDQGGYTKDNCRFITTLENQRERKHQKGPRS